MEKIAVPPKEIYVVGAGGHGKVAVRAAQISGVHVVAIFDDDPNKWKSDICGVPVVGPVHSITRQARRPTLLAIGNNVRRLAIAEELGLPWATIVHPAACVDDLAQLGEGILILAGAVIQVDSSVGDHAIINDNATVEHDCQIGVGAHISCNACLTGAALVGRAALIGAGAVVLPGIRVGDYSTVGAGAVVTRPVSEADIVAGVPARSLTSQALRVA